MPLPADRNHRASPAGVVAGCCNSMERTQKARRGTKHLKAQHTLLLFSSQALTRLPTSIKLLGRKSYSYTCGASPLLPVHVEPVHLFIIWEFNIKATANRKIGSRAPSHKVWRRSRRKIIENNRKIINFSLPLRVACAPTSRGPRACAPTACSHLLHMSTGSSYCSPWIANFICSPWIAKFRVHQCALR